MSLNEFIRKKRDEQSPNLEELPVEQGFMRFFIVLQVHFWELVTLNLLLLAFSIPVITIPAALCATNRSLFKMISKGDCFSFSDFFTEFKISFVRSLPFGALHALLLFNGIVAFMFGITEHGVNVPFTVLAIFISGSTIVFFSYVYVFIPALTLNNKQVAGNAFIFALTQWKTNLVIIIGSVAMIVAMVAISAFSVLLALVPLVLISFSFNQLVICTAVYKPMRKRIIDPYESESMSDMDK